MTRWVAGVFDPRGHSDNSRLTQALAPRAASLVECGPLRVAYTGLTIESTNPICLLGGFVDNTNELRRECNAAAIRSDELLLACGYRRWGAELPAYLRGDFALVIWDCERREGLLARDQLGVRCLYLCDAGGTLYFASEISQLLVLLPRRPAPDPAGVAHWVAASHRPGTGTMYDGVRRLVPGGAVHLTLDGLRERRYWTPRFVEPRERDDAELSESLRDALGHAVRCRLATGGRTGILMSGGLDSASVAAIAAKQAPGRIAAYAAVFPDHPAVDESGFISELRTALALPGLNAEVRPGGLLASALESQSIWQLPLASWGEFWGLPLLRAAASFGIEVILGGDGGDEVFDTRAFLLADHLRAGKLRQMLRLTRELPWGGQPGLRALMRVAGNIGVAGAVPYALHAPLSRPFATRALPAWLTHRTAADLIATDDPLAWKRLDGPRWWAHAAHSLTRIEEVGVFEMHRHRAALAGVEARHPLLDLGLMELVLGQSPNTTFDRHRSRPALRASMRGLLPDTVRLRHTKTLFDSLIVDSLTKSDGAAVRGLLSNPRAEIGAYVNAKLVQRLLLDNDAAKSRDPLHWMLHVWRLTTAECWLRAQADPDQNELPNVSASPRRVTLRDANAPGLTRRKLDRTPAPRLQPQH